MFVNWNQLELAAKANNLPALVEALIAAPSVWRVETPGWITGKSRESLIRLLRTTQEDGDAGDKYLAECRQRAIDARRFEKVREVLQQQPELANQVGEIKQVIREHRASQIHGSNDPTLYLREREEYLTAVGKSLQSACETAARLVADEGHWASGAAVLRSYKLLEGFDVEEPYYIPRSLPVLAAFRIIDVCRPKAEGANFEQALLGERYRRLRPPDRHCRPLSSGDRTNRPSREQPASMSLPWALDPPSVPKLLSDNPDHALEYAVRAGNPLALVSGLDLYCRQGGLAPSWLLQSAAWWIIALLRRKGEAGARSVLTTCAQRLVDCERYRLIERKQRKRLDLYTQAKRHCERKGFGRQATSERLRSLGLLYPGSLDAAIRDTLADVDGTPLHADFETAKKAFNRVRKAPHLLREHWTPPEYVSRLLGLPVFEAAQKVGNEYPHFADNP